VKRMLLAQKSYVEGALALSLYCAHLVEREKTDPDAAALLGLLTPVAKTWPSEYGLAANDLAIQIHGGYGYTRDFDVEQLWRDNRLNPIHEGTTGIQAIDLVGRKILRDGSGLRVLDAAVRRSADAAGDVAGLAGHARALLDAWQNILVATRSLAEGDEARAFDNATPFLQAFGHVVLAWLWLDQAVAARRATGLAAEASFLQGKLMACCHFFEAELPKVDAWLSPVTGRSDAALRMPASAF
jgi:hypothetical protein